MKQVFSILDAMRHPDDRLAQLASLRAQVNLAIAEGREPRLVEALEKHIAELEGRTPSSPITNVDRNYREAGEFTRMHPGPSPPRSAASPPPSSPAPNSWKEKFERIFGNPLPPKPSKGQRLQSLKTWRDLAIVEKQATELIEALEVQIAILEGRQPASALTDRQRSLVEAGEPTLPDNLT